MTEEKLTEALNTREGDENDIEELVSLANKEDD